MITGKFTMAENLNNTLLQLMREALIVLDSSDHVIISNDAAGKLFDTTGNQLVGKHLSELYHDQNEVDNFNFFLNEYKRLAHWENTFIKSGGETFTGSYSASIIKDIQHPSVFKLLLIQDVTEKKITSEELTRCSDQLRQREQELNQFTYIVTHDLKAPLRAINNLSDWIEEDVGPLLSGEVSKNFAMLKARVSRMESMIEGLSEYSKIKLENSFERIEVSQLVTDVIDQVRVPAHIEVEQEGEMPTLFTDKKALSKVFYNLISNAFRHNNKETGWIKIQSQRKGNYFEFIVKDNGPGIPVAYHEKIFLVFQTLVPKDQTESTGIGLTIAKRIVESYGGQIEVKSENGNGAAFAFTWPDKNPNIL